MNIIKFLDAPLASAGTLADKRQVLVNVSSEDPDRAGDIVEQTGIDYSNFVRTGATILFNHDPSTPIAKSIDMGVVGGKLRSLAQFPPAGTSARADEVLGLIQAGIVCSASIGFRSLESEPINLRDPRAGIRYKKVELVEFSFVSTPANVAATVLAKGLKMSEMPNAEDPTSIMRALEHLKCMGVAHKDMENAFDLADMHRRAAIRHAGRAMTDDTGGADVELSYTERERAKRLREIEILALGG